MAKRNDDKTEATAEEQQQSEAQAANDPQAKADAAAKVPGTNPSMAGPSQDDLNPAFAPVKEDPNDSKDSDEK